MLLRHFEEAEAECRAILAAPVDPKTGKRIVMAHPAYDQCIKASHLFNLLDARGVISVTERQAYIGRVRALAKACADAFETEAGWAAACGTPSVRSSSWLGPGSSPGRGGDVLAAGLRLLRPRCGRGRRLTSR
jgi:glycyl-tRNA synthetase alpha subunit